MLDPALFRVPRSLLVTASVVMLAGPDAFAHGARPSVYDIAERDGEVSGLATTFGPIVGGADGVLRWTCADAVPVSATGYLFVEGRVIATSTQGLWSSSDGGCSFDPMDSAIGDRIVSELRRDQGVGYLVTSEIDTPNGVFRTEDGGLTWQAWGDPIDAAIFGLAADAGRVVVSALSAEDGWTVREWSDAGPGAPISLPEGLLDIEVWIADDRVWLADVTPAESTFFALVDDGIEQWGGPVAGVITDVHVAAGEVFVATDTNQVYLATAAELIATDDEGACFSRSEDGTLLRCGTTDARVAVYQGELGDGSVAIPFGDIVPAECVWEPEHACSSLTQFATNFLGSAEDQPRSSGGCAVASSNNGATRFCFSLLAVILGCLPRRRMRTVRSAGMASWP